ncbi:hypothetical protein GN244_ATG13146 [Phytophthora infestans]|uniref:Uncharacterized protein n=1 Tax=Phytophthora infestans TaxID=4787 RepID=A0A833T0D4_PHYIN|nr:hypothetical protein GN244_ATG13146 [Phytophthora infestans]KAF4135243.1 hypothetical protein GN958_ATG15562 [Phytophthora infestans]
MVQMAPSSPYIARVRQALGKLHITESEVASWRLTIHKTLTRTQQGDSQQAGRGQTAETRAHELLRKQTTLLEQQTKIVDGLLTQARLLSDRVQKLEGSSCGPATPLPVPPLQPGASEVNRPAAASLAAGRRKLGPKSLTAVRYHETKVTVAFMRLLLPNGYDATGNCAVDKERILETGREAEANIRGLLDPDHKKAKSYGTVIRVLKAMHEAGKLNGQIQNYHALVREGRVTDDSPPKSFYKLSLCSIQDST